MRVDERGLDVRMAQQLLNHAQVSAAVHEMRGISMSKAVQGNGLVYASGFTGVLEHIAQALGTIALTFLTGKNLGRWLIFLIILSENGLERIWIGNDAILTTFGIFKMNGLALLIKICNL